MGARCPDVDGNPGQRRRVIARIRIPHGPTPGAHGRPLLGFPTGGGAPHLVLLLLLEGLEDPGLELRRDADASARARCDTPATLKTLSDKALMASSTGTTHNNNEANT